MLYELKSEHAEIHPKLVGREFVVITKERSDQNTKLNRVQVEDQGNGGKFWISLNCLQPKE